MKKILCLLLAALTLLGSTACASSEDNPRETDASTALKDTTPESEVETVNQNFVCDLPEDLDFGGETMVFLYADVTGRKDEMVPDEAGGLVSDSVHERNVAIEEDLKIKMDMVTNGNLAGAVKNDYNAGTATYHIITCATNTSISLAMQGYFLDLNRLDYIDTSKHYWTQGYNDMVTFTDADMQFLASGPMALSMFRYMFFTIYNKELFEDYHVDDLYDVVMNGEWTLDYQYSILEGKYVEMDADGKPTKDDFYGFVTGDTISVDPYVVATNIHLVIKDPATGELRYNPDAVEPLADVCDKVQKIYNSTSTFVYKGMGVDDVQKTNIIDHFNNERALMATTIFLQMERNFDALTRLTYGIAPIPKYSSEQENYGSYVQDQVSSFGISGAIADEDHRNRVAAVMEALAYHSYLIVLPAYYDTALSERYMQDPQSSEVLDLMYDSLQFDFSSTCCNIFTNCVIRDNLRPLLSGRANTIVSSTKGWERSINNTLTRKYNPKLEEMKPD